MNLEEYQAAARRTTNPSLNERDRILDAAMGLAEESAEVLGLLRKHAFQSRPIDRVRLSEELGDTLWCLAMTADALGLKLGEIAEDNISKLRVRHPNGFGR